MDSEMTLSEFITAQIAPAWTCLIEDHAFDVVLSDASGHHERFVTLQKGEVAIEICVVPWSITDVGICKLDVERKMPLYLCRLESLLGERVVDYSPMILGGLAQDLVAKHPEICDGKLPNILQKD